MFEAESGESNPGNDTVRNVLEYWTGRIRIAFKKMGDAKWRRIKPNEVLAEDRWEFAEVVWVHHEQLETLQAPLRLR